MISSVDSASAGTAISKEVIVCGHLPIVCASIEQVINEIPGLKTDSIKKLSDLPEPQLYRAGLLIMEDPVQRIKNGDYFNIDYHKVPTLMYALEENDAHLLRYLGKGVRGMIPMTSSAEEWKKATSALLDGNVYVPPHHMDRMLKYATSHFSRDRLISVPEPFCKLSDQEVAIYECIGCGMATKEIAGRIHLSPRIIESHYESIKKKLGVGSLAELKRYAIRHTTHVAH